MVSRSRSLNDLMVALTAAGVPVNLRVESQANPNLLIGIAQGASQAAVIPGNTGFGLTAPKLRVGWDAAQQVTIASLPLSISPAAGSRFPIQAVDTVATDLNSISQGVGLESLLTAPTGNQSQLLQQEPTTFELQTVQHLGTTGLDPRKVDPGLADSKSAGGVLNNPGATTDIVTLTPGTAGNWQVTAYCGVFGTTAIGDDGNMNLLKDAATISALAMPTGSVFGFGPFRLILTSTNVLKLQTIGIGTVGTRYVGQLLATRTG